MVTSFRARALQAVKKLFCGVVPRSASDVVAHLNRASKIWLVGELVGAGGASLGGPYGAAKAHCCVAGR